MKTEIFLQKSFELDFGEKMKRHVMIKRGKLKEVVISEKLATIIYNKYSNECDKKHYSHKITSIKNIIENQKFNLYVFDVKKEVSIYPKYGYLCVESKNHKTDSIVERFIKIKVD